MAGATESRATAGWVGVVKGVEGEGLAVEEKVAVVEVEVTVEEGKVGVDWEEVDWEEEGLAEVETG